MIIINNCVLIGRLTNDPELRFLPGNGQAVAKFSLAVDRGLAKDKKEELKQQGKPTADFIRIVVWGKSAENCANYLAKGKQVAIQGSIETGSYTNQQGQKVYTTDIRANRVEFIEWRDKNNTSSNNGNDDINIPGFSDTDENMDDIPF